MKTLLRTLAGGLLMFMAATAGADEEPISGTVQSIDTAAQTLTLQSTARAKTREVVIHLTPGTKIVRFVRPLEGGKTGFVEQTIALADLRPGWIVSAATRHEGDKEVAETIKVVLER